MKIDREKYLQLFLSELDEQLTALNRLLVDLEADRHNKNAINEIFRLTHTIKGNAAAMGFEKISEFSHRVEDVFDLLRRGEIDFSTSVANAVFRALDELKDMISHLRQTHTEKEEISPIVDVLAKIASGEPNWEQMLSRIEVEEQVKISDVARVPMQRLDSVINLIGEMLINISRLEMINRQVGSEELKNTIAYIRRIVSDLQYIIMDVRLVPLSSIFDQLPRMVRDIAQQEGKEVSLLVDGAEIQLDSRVVERIKTPIIQIVRNAISHGIEPPEERARAGKPLQGKVRILAQREKGRVKISISDDGGGIATDVIAETAVSLGIVDRDRVEQMDEDEVLALIFEPGFTTAKRASKVSGRGVGMDAVRSEITSIGGAISVHSEPGRGTTFSIIAPVSIAIVKSLLCNVQGNVYAFPVSSIEAIRHIPRGEIHRMNGDWAFRYEESIVPILYVGEVLFGSKSPIEENDDDILNVVVVNTANELVGFSVDELIREDDLMVKTIDVLTDVRTVSGASLLGDGSVVLILDANEMVKKASMRKAV